MSGNRVTKEQSDVDKVAISGMRSMDTGDDGREGVRCVDTADDGGKG